MSVDEAWPRNTAPVAVILPPPHTSAEYAPLWNDKELVESLVGMYDTLFAATEYTCSLIGIEITPVDPSAHVTEMSTLPYTFITDAG